MVRKKTDQANSSSQTEAHAPTGRFAYEGLERVIHEKARLGIMTSLLAQPTGVLFGDLKELCSLTDGNLNRHLKVLQEAGLIEIWKGSHANRPQTLVRVTPVGRTKFIEYVTELERVIADATKIRDAEPARSPSPQLGWIFQQG
jgi:DNA-binding MarR family transcriptional regulator